jgi:predicted ATP-dependent serine protease
MSKVAYRVSKVEGQCTLTSQDAGQIIVTEEHPKFEWLQSLAADRVVNISSSGRWTASADYTGLLTQVAKAEQKPVKVKLTRLDDLRFSDDLFRPMQTGTCVDKFLSTDGGFMPGSNIMAAGAPGVGKTTVLLELLSKVVAEDPMRKVLFISAEMNQLDMGRYLKRFPHWGQLPILFLSDYTDQNPKEVIEQTLNQGWDLVLTDSYTEVNDTVKEECNMTRSKTEKWFLDLMIAQNAGKNKLKKYTTFITILQLSKGGTFVGSNKLKHMTTAMMHLDWKGGENSTERYMAFSKNRLGQVGQKLFFSFEKGVEFDQMRYQRDLLNDELIAEEREKLKTEGDAFDRIFGSMETDLAAEAVAE